MLTKSLGRNRFAVLGARVDMVEVPPGTKAKGVNVGIPLGSSVTFVRLWACPSRGNREKASQTLSRLEGK